LRLSGRPPRWLLVGTPLVLLLVASAALPLVPPLASGPPVAEAQAITPLTPAIVTYINTQSRPVGLGVDPGLNRIFVSHNDVGTGLMTIDGTTHQTQNYGGLNLGQDLSVNKKLHKVYVGNDGGAFVTVYDGSNPNNYQQVGVGAGNPFGSASYESFDRTYVMIHQSGKIATLDSNTNGVVSFQATQPSGWDPGRPLLGVVDEATAFGPRLYVTKFNSPAHWGLESYDLQNPNQPNLVYNLQYDTCGRPEADALGVAYNPVNHDIYLSYNGPRSDCQPGIAGYFTRFDQSGGGKISFELPLASVGNLIYIRETNRIYAIQKQDGLLYVLNAANMAPIMGPLQIGRTPNSGPERGIAYNPNTGLVYVASLRTNEITVFRDFLVSSPTATPTVTSTPTQTPTTTPTPLPTCRAATAVPVGGGLTKRLLEPIIQGGLCRPFGS
jgi:DNA-binding beta-propeller fold protein YncE